MSDFRARGVFCGDGKKQRRISLPMATAAIDYMTAFPGCGMTAARRFGARMPLFILTALAIVFARRWLVPAFGFMGAAVALIIDGMFKLFGSVVIVFHAVRRVLEGAKA